MICLINALIPTKVVIENETNAYSVIYLSEKLNRSLFRFRKKQKKFDLCDDEYYISICLRLNNSNSVIRNLERLKSELFGEGQLYN